MRSDETYEAAAAEFNEVISCYMLPMFDVRGKAKLKKQTSVNSEIVSYDSCKGVMRFYPCIGTKESPSPFFCEVGTYSTSGMRKRLETIMRELLRVMEFNCSNGKIRRQRAYGKSVNRREAYKKRTLDLAFELGMCVWLIPDYAKATTLYSILCKMIDWAGKTYEGKNVPFGFVVNFDLEASEEAVSYLHYLESDSSAVFTDGIFSGILLDKEGRLVSFLTRDSQCSDGNDDHELFVPYQFHDMAKHCTKNSIGIIVLTNGEILLIKDRAICFAKRGNKWVAFDWERVYVKLRPYFLLDSNREERLAYQKIKAIYCTLLDVSFSHTGGCLAVVIPNVETEDISKVIKDRFDLTIDGRPPKGITKENKEKIKVLKNLLADTNDSIRSFYEIEKPLRKEILSLDGATVVSLDGGFYCAGSIVSVPSGSSGGGRTAAAKQLAQVGIGIKVSEDGYIEAYGVPLNTNRESGNNSKIIPLFKIK